MVYIRTKENQRKHDSGVANFARQVISAGWNVVYSDLPGNPKPPIVNNFIPDIYAFHKNGREYAVEIETADSVNTQHALRQRVALQTWVNASSGTRSFEVRLV